MLDKELWAYIWELEKLWRGRSHYQESSGLYMRNISGKGLELKDIRLYQPGDDVRRIDWNAQARTGEVYTREYLEENDIRIHFFLDISSSMIPFQNHAFQCLLFYSILALAKKYKLYWSFFHSEIIRSFHFSQESELFSGSKKFKHLWFHEKEGIKTDITLPFREMESKVNMPSLVVIISDFQDIVTANLPKFKHFYAGIRYFVPENKDIESFFIQYDSEFQNHHNTQYNKFQNPSSLHIQGPYLEYDASLPLETSLKRCPLVL
jgi:hypothetical protein